MTYSIAVAGASGYAGGEFLRLLLGHPAYVDGTLTLGALTGASQAGKPLGESQPHLLPLADKIIEDTTVERLAQHDVVVLGLPHGESARIAKQLPSEVLIIDLGADFRLESAEAWEKWYGGTHAGTWTYGLPELPGQRDKLRLARQIAVPGCFPTGASLAMAPAVANGLVEPDLTFVSITGTSGAGKSAKVAMLGSEVMGSLKAYGVGGTHRHTPEIIQNLQRLTEETLTVSFTPVLAPLPRGILTTASAKLAAGVSPEAVREAYVAAYAEEPFVAVLPAGTQPMTKSVVGSNAVHLGVEVDELAGRVVVTTAIDNLTKGTAGGALQSLNLALGFTETAGLPLTGLAP